MTKEEAYVKSLDEKTGASLKLTVLNPKGRVWLLVAGGAGLQAMLSRSLGLALDLQAAAIFRKKFQMLASPSLALVLKF